MRESCTYGSVRGASSNGGPYRDRQDNNAAGKRVIAHEADVRPDWQNTNRSTAGAAHRRGSNC
jgi:hypothetical protein